MEVMEKKMDIEEESDCFIFVITEKITRNLTIIHARIMVAEDMEIREEVMILNRTQSNDTGSHVELVTAN